MLLQFGYALDRPVVLHEMMKEEVVEGGGGGGGGEPV